MNLGNCSSIITLSSPQFTVEMSGDGRKGITEVNYVWVFASNNLNCK